MTAGLDLGDKYSHLCLIDTQSGEVLWRRVGCAPPLRPSERASEHIPEALQPALEPILEQIGSLTERIRDYDRKLEAISKEHYPETDLLRQVEGVGTLTALTFVLTLKDPRALRRAER
jgi:transposase